MATVHETPSGRVLSVKGAPEAVLPRCQPGPARAQLEAAVTGLGREGLRVLALASGPTDDLDAAGLDALGLVGFTDPLRPSAVDAVARCRRAGIRITLVTGDHLVTARAIADEAGLDSDPAVTGQELSTLAGAQRADALRGAAIVARVDPSTKVELVAANRAAGDVVAMTGDGVNDAPALREADIGVAFAGEAGTDVAREAAALVVTDGDLQTLVAAVAEGRRIWHNLVSVLSYLLAGNVSEVLVVLGCIVLLPDLKVPLLPVQLLWVNFVTDGLPALALGVDTPPGDPLGAPPRSRTEHLLGWRRQLVLAGRAAVVAAGVLATGVLALRWGWPHEAVRTQLLLSLLGAHLLLAYVSRADRLTFASGWWRNTALLGAVSGSLALQGLAFGTAPGRALLGLSALRPAGWLLAAAAMVFSVVVIDAGRVVAARHAGARP
jgi:magnesium-transporting ATPase (P-type)